MSSQDQKSPIDKKSKIGLAVGLSIGAAIAIFVFSWFLCCGPLRRMYRRRIKAKKEARGVIIMHDLPQVEAGQDHMSDTTKGDEVPEDVGRGKDGATHFR
jgi:hypothetical protein